MSTPRKYLLFVVAFLFSLFPFAGLAAHAATSTVVPGSTLVLSVSADGTSPFSYAWYKDGTALSGATASSYSVSNIQSGNAGTYSAVVSNSAGSATSDNMLVTVSTAVIAPAITAQPVSQAVTTGANVSFAASASGTPAPTYQWKFNGTPISGATNSTLTITNVQSSNAGTYTLVAANSAGSAISNGATLTVNTVNVHPAITTQPVSQTVSAGGSVTFVVAAIGTPTPAYQWKLNGVAISGATSTTLSITNVQSANAGTYTFSASNSLGTATSNGAILTVNSAAVAPAITTQPASQTVTAGANVTFTAAASGSPVPSYQWKLNGSVISGATSATLGVANVQSANAGAYTLVATNSAGSVTSNAATLTVNPVPVAPTISTQPASQTVTAGANVTFSVVASGTPAPTYQWKLNGTALAGATSASLTVANVQSANSGTYTLIATNSAGSVTSNAATLTISAVPVHPVITTQPVSQAVTAGGSVTFVAAAIGSPTPTYQWKLNGVAISGATNATLTIANAQQANAGSYALVATNSVGSITSNVATLTVNPGSVAPVISTQPVGQTVTAGTSVTFMAVASGTPAPTFQWKLNGAAISGATSATLNIANAQSANAGNYTLVATNSAGSVASSTALLTVNPAMSAPVFTTQPVSRAIVAGGAVTFTAVADGNPVPAYQWRKNGANIVGATGNSYSIDAAKSADLGTYTVVATNSVGTVVSSVAVLAVRLYTSTVSVHVDLNGDGKADILWQNVQTGECSAWLMDGAKVGSIIQLGSMSIDWQVGGAGDFNGDGKADILWQNSLTGECRVWLMADASVGSIVTLGTVPLDWQIGGAGDFDGDGKADIFWQSSLTGDCSVWLMNGSSIISTQSLGSVSVDWIIKN